jgi:hypothetical protein
VGEAWQQTGAASGAAALNRADRDIEHCRCLRDWVPLHIDEHEGGTLLFWEFGEGGDQLPVEVLAFGGDGSGLVRVEQRLQALGVVGERSAPGGGLAGAVQAGVDRDAVQPGGDRGLAAEGVGRAVGGDEGVLHGVGGFLAVCEGPQGDGPEAVAVAADDLAERVRIALDMAGEELPVGDGGCVR